jgi:hypothetical protein
MARPPTWLTVLALLALLAACWALSNAAALQQATL